MVEEGMEGESGALSLAATRVNETKEEEFEEEQENRFYFPLFSILFFSVLVSGYHFAGLLGILCIGIIYKE